MCERPGKNVLISGHEICGIIADMADEFTRRGYDVTTIAMANKFFERRYDYDQYDFAVSALAKKFGMKGLWDRSLQMVWALAPRLHQKIEWSLRAQLIRTADVYIRVWGTSPFDREGLAEAVRSGGLVATLFMGSDVRHYPVFETQYGKLPDSLPIAYYDVPLGVKLETLRMHERYSDAIFSVPDQMGLALRPYHHLQVPIKLADLTYAVHGREIPRVLHVANSPEIKGTRIIEAALSQLAGEGVEFHYTRIVDTPHEEVLRIVSEADVVVDEIVCHGPGWLSFEAMGSGCAVATRYLEDSPQCFQPPIWNINDTNIVDRLRILLTDRALRVRLGQEGRRYVEENNRIEQVVDRLLERMQSGRGGAHDYAPSYLATEYIPPSEVELEAINANNDLVSAELWYAQATSGMNHHGIRF